jgi:hypothetical protein
MEVKYIKEIAQLDTKKDKAHTGLVSKKNVSEENSY